MAKENLFSLKNSEQVRNSITNKQRSEIKQSYMSVWRDVKKKIENTNENRYKKQDLFVLKRNIEYNIKQINEDIKENITTGMNTVSEQVVEDNKEYLLHCGFKEDEIHGAFLHIPNKVIQSIASGNIYQDGWTLSKAIWGADKHVQDCLNKIISIGTAQGKSAYQIAKDIEMYVKPDAAKPSRVIQSWIEDKNGNKHFERFFFGQVDYNAQRLARTLISHAYQQAFEMVNEHDPFVKGYKWLTSNFHGRVCEVCRERAETDQYGLGVGVFPKGELPLDHPNGMCTFEVVFNRTDREIGEAIGDWYNNPIGTFPDIDEYVKSMRG